MVDLVTSQQQFKPQIALHRPGPLQQTRKINLNIKILWSPTDEQKQAIICLDFIILHIGIKSPFESYGQKRKK